MALRTALVDRARIVRREAAGPRLMGTTPMADIAGPWFRCRLELPQGPEDGGDPNLRAGRRKAIPRPRLMFDRIDELRGVVAVSFADRLEVASPELGTALWRVTQTPAPIRKRRAVIGWEASLERVVEDDFQRRGA